MSQPVVTPPGDLPPYRSPKYVQLWLIKRIVCEYYDIDEAELLATRRAKSIVRKRQIAEYFAKKLTSHSLFTIGRAFGGRDHTTIMHSARKIEALRNSDPQLDADLRKIEDRLCKKP
jgi:chromosomal replication initiator protein